MLLQVANFHSFLWLSREGGYSVFIFCKYIYIFFGRLRDLSFLARDGVPRQWKHGVLTTGPQRIPYKSLHLGRGIAVQEKQGRVPLSIVQNSLAALVWALGFLCSTELPQFPFQTPLVFWLYVLPEGHCWPGMPPSFSLGFCCPFCLREHLLQGLIH